MPRLQLSILPLCLALLAPTAGLAQSNNEMSPQGQATSVGAMPSRGMTMEQVKQHFGEPQRRIAPVGDPPISRWQYDGMVVYFEHQYVIHAVATGNNDK